MSGSPARFKCQDCTIIITPKITVSDKEDFSFSMYYSVSYGGFTLMNYALQRSSTPTPLSLCWWFTAHHRRPYSQPSQIIQFCSRLLNNVDVWYLAARKAVSTSNALRHACATHCRALGGCPVNLYQSDGAASMPSSSQVFQPVASQSNPSRNFSYDHTYSYQSSFASSINLCYSDHWLIIYWRTTIAGTSSGVTVSHAPRSSTPITCSHGALPPAYANCSWAMFIVHWILFLILDSLPVSHHVNRSCVLNSVKHTVSLCFYAWLSVCLHSPFISILLTITFFNKDNDEPEESVQQGGFVERPYGPVRTVVKQEHSLDHARSYHHPTRREAVALWLPYNTTSSN
jgi:hypothetical protein